MKASDMTNEELAKELIETVGLDGPFCICERCSTVREAAARLRRPTPVDDDLLKMARDIDRFRTKLKVAEDALEKCVNYNSAWAHEAAEENAKNALAAIREKGATNG